MEDIARFLHEHPPFSLLPFDQVRRVTELIQIEYFVDPHNRHAFLRAVSAVEGVRRRNGASSWRIFRDLEDEGRYVERFVIKSWAEYTRQRARMTIAERDLQAKVVALHREGIPIRISRLIGVEPFDA